MKKTDIYLKPGTYIKSSTTQGDVQGISLENFVVSVLNNPTCCVKPVLPDGILKTVLPLSATSQFVKDNVGNTSALSLSTSAIGVGGLINATGFGQKIRAIGAGDASIGIYRNQASSFPAKLEFMKSRGTYDIPLTVSANDQIGNIGFYGYDGTAYRQSAAINATAVSTSATYVEGTIKLSVWNNTGSNFDKIGIYKEGVYVGDTVAVPTAQLQIRGSGATTATTSLLVQNSAGTQMLKVTDNSVLTLANSVTVNPQTSGIAAVAIQNTAGNGTPACSVTAGIGLTASSTNGADANNPDGASIIAYGGTSGGLGKKSVGIRSNRALISAGFAQDIVDSAMLQVDSTTTGFLPPRMTTVQKNAIVTPAAGLIVYDSTLNKLCVRTAAAWETIQSI